MRRMQPVSELKSRSEPASLIDRLGLRGLRVRASRQATTAFVVTLLCLGGASWLTLERAGAAQAQIGGIAFVPVAIGGIGLLVGRNDALPVAIIGLVLLRIVVAISEGDVSTGPLWIALILMAMEAAAWSADARPDSVVDPRARLVRGALVVGTGTAAATLVTIASRWHLEPNVATVGIATTVAVALVVLLVVLARPLTPRNDR